MHPLSLNSNMRRLRPDSMGSPFPGTTVHQSASWTLSGERQERIRTLLKRTHRVLAPVLGGWNFLHVEERRLLHGNSAVRPPIQGAKQGHRTDSARSVIPCHTRHNDSKRETCVVRGFTKQFVMGGMACSGAVWRCLDVTTVRKSLREGGDNWHTAHKGQPTRIQF